LAAPLAAVLAAPALAQELPATFHVAGVAARDVLNVRARPSTGAEVLATLRPDARGIEVLSFSPDGDWALVPLAEGPGWVARRFLEAEPVDPDRIPRPIACRGTEPFWSLTLEEGSATLELPGRPALSLRQHGEVAGREGWIAAFDLGGQTADLTVVRRACSDGMSDRPYGLYALVWDRADRLYEGCCTLQP
jgi:uncharacterized membrane protein